jgi:hypothetical protein
MLRSQNWMCRQGLQRHNLLDTFSDLQKIEITIHQIGKPFCNSGEIRPLNQSPYIL